MLLSHPTWVRGLKPLFLLLLVLLMVSHPTWVRGLKLTLVRVLALTLVAPYVGAWIETINNQPDNFICQCRTLRGCVD